MHRLGWFRVSKSSLGASHMRLAEFRAYEPWSRSLKGVYVGAYMWEYYRDF